jgi:hypothetical protein
MNDIDEIARRAYSTRQKELWGLIKESVAEFSKNSYPEVRDFNSMMIGIRQHVAEYNEIMKRAGFRGDIIVL